MFATQRRNAVVAGALVSTVVLAVALPSAAQIYKWVDESGTVHFTDSPPARGGAVEVLPATTPRPRPTESSTEARDDSEPRHGEAEAPADAVQLDDDWGDEPELVDEEVATEIIVESGSDPAVRRRANSPRNRPGQPIRQPGGQSGQRPARGR